MAFSPAHPPFLSLLHSSSLPTASGISHSFLLFADCSLAPASHSFEHLCEKKSNKKHLFLSSPFSRFGLSAPPVSFFRHTVLFNVLGHLLIVPVLLAFQNPKPTPAPFASPSDKPLGPIRQLGSVATFLNTTQTLP
jgi:hypothetical protein